MEHKFNQGTKLERSGKMPEESMKIRARTRKKRGQDCIAPSGMDFAPDGLKRKLPWTALPLPLPEQYHLRVSKTKDCIAPSGVTCTPYGVEIDPNGETFAPSGAS